MVKSRQEAHVVEGIPSIKEGSSKDTWNVNLLKCSTTKIKVLGKYLLVKKASYDLRGFWKDITRKVHKKEFCSHFSNDKGKKNLELSP